MAKLLTAASIGLALVCGLCVGFHSAAAEDKPAAKEPTKVTRANVRGSYAQIMNALDSAAEFDYIETPLKDVVEHLQILFGVHIRIDVSAITDAGGAPDMPITFSMKGISLRSALRLMLRDRGLDFMIVDEVLLITTAEKPSLRQYDVSDLVLDGSNVDELVNLVRFALPRVPAAAAKLGPESAAGASPAGSPAGVGGVPADESATVPDGEIATYGNLFLVRTSDRGHMIVNNLLEEMRHHLKPGAKTEPQAESPDRPAAIPRSRKR